MTAAIVVAGLGFATGAEAKTFKVTRGNDPNPGKCAKKDCSLREAVLAANASGGADKVVLPKAGKYKLTRKGSSSTDGDLDVSGPLSIVHPGKGRATIDAKRLKNRILDIDPDASTTLSKLVLRGGKPKTDDGGAIESEADLTVKKSVLTKNSSADDGGAIDMDQDTSDPELKLIGTKIVKNKAADEGGGIDGDDSSAITITKSTIHKNVAGGTGGGMEGGGSGLLRITRSTISDNESGENGGGVIHASSSPVEIDSSTFSGNSAAGTGGGAHFDGPNATITNSTFDGNEAEGFGGGIQAQDGADVALNAVTITRNHAFTEASKVGSAGGGLFRLSSLGFEVRNSLIALNVAGASEIPNDCGDDGTEIDSLGYNLISSTNGDCDAFDEATDILAADPAVKPLKDNGGPTKTVALNPATDEAAGSADPATAPDVDQRGMDRDAAPDIGAFEHTLWDLRRPSVRR